MTAAPTNTPCTNRTRGCPPAEGPPPAQVFVVVLGNRQSGEGPGTVEDLAGGRGGGPKGFEALDRERELRGMEHGLIAVVHLLLRMERLALLVVRDFRLQLRQHLGDGQIRAHSDLPQRRYNLADCREDGDSA